MRFIIPESDPRYLSVVRNIKKEYYEDHRLNWAETKSAVERFSFQTNALTLNQCFITHGVRARHFKRIMFFDTDYGTYHRRSGVIVIFDLMLYLKWVE